MDATQIAALREEFSTAQAGAHKIITLAATEKRDLTADEQGENDKRFTRMEQIKKQFDEHKKFAELALAEGRASVAVVAGSVAAAKVESDVAENRQNYTDKDGKFDLAKFRAAVNHFGRTGEERQLFTVTTSTGSGAYLPKDVLQPVVVRRLSNSWRAVLAAKGYSPIETDSLASFSLPVADDTANVGQAQSESATSGTELDPTNTNALTINPTVYSSKQFWYSNTMVMAQGFDIVGFTLPMASKRIDKVQESAWTTEVLAGATGYTTASPTAMTYAELLNWEHTLAPAYRNDACFVISDSLYRVFRGLVDNNNRPIMDQNPQDTFQVSVHGKPCIINDYMQTVAANHALGAFASADAIKIVDVMNARLARYANYPAKPDQIGFEMFQNGDFAFVPNGISLLRSAVS